EVPPPPAEKIHPPDEELQAFVPADGFEMNLWASEANGLVKPVQFTWDERGRLWALCAPSYPQLIPGIAANDFILVCEDTDGDGRADKFDRFAEGLVMPTGLVLGDGGVYLCETTQLVHLADTDGDGHADSRRVIFSGFGTGDSHQMINSICWGPDGRLWFTQGLHIFSTIETPRGLVKCSQTGIWRLNPRTLELQNFLGNAAATENAWGVGFDDWGQTFYNPGNQPNCVYLDPALAPVPSKYLTKNQYAPVGSLAVSKSKGMEIEFLGSSHLPDELQGLMVKSIYFASYIDLHELVDDGSGFGSLPRGDLVSSTSTLFRPLETKTGPDGAIYICDWCNPIIGHYQASYRDPARDHSHGRIWRMTAKNRPLVKRPPLEKMSTTELIEQLRSPERWVRGQAQEQLYRLPSNEVVKAGDDRLDSIILARRARTDDRLAAAAVPAPAGPGVKYAGVPADAAEQNEHLLYELTGVFAAHEAVRPALVELLCTSPEPRLRAFGTHMIGLWADRLSDPLELLARMAVDEFPRVRMEAAVAASYVRSPRAMEVATLVLNKPHDRFIDYALTQTVLTLRPEWFPAVAKGELSFDNQPDRLAFVLAADGTAEGARLVRQFSERPELSDDARARSWALLARAGDADDLRYALDHGLRHAAVLDALAVAASQRGKVPSGELAEPLRPLMAAEDDALRGAAIRLAGAWRLKSLAPAIREQVERGGGEGSRLAAIGAIATIEGHDALPLLTPLIEAKHPQPVRAAAIKAIAAIDLVKAAQSTADEMTDIKDQAVMADFVLPVVDRQGGAKLLADALEKKSLTADPAKLAHRALSANGHAEPALVTVLNRAIGISAGQVEYSPQVVARLAETVTEQGDARKGRDLFLSKLANCTACHKVAGQGGDIGPDLSVVGAGLPLPLIIESLLWPNRQVKEGYAATRVVTSDGQILVGYKLKDTPEEVQLREIATREVRRIAREDIEEMAGVGSVMPAGLTVGMTSEEVRDLVRYLSELGRGSR
ncbi:MAG TPA: PVC-type heme-binding CxxCH protein, partial [Pirellulales bacterium]|nr:PVC-type heme-binding CxxCH protein [Pirellulales bacterium]